MTTSALTLSSEPAALVLKRNSRSFALAAALLRSEERERVAEPAGILQQASHAQRKLTICTDSAGAKRAGEFRRQHAY